MAKKGRRRNVYINLFGGACTHWYTYTYTEIYAHIAGVAWQLVFDFEFRHANGRSRLVCILLCHLIFCLLSHLFSSRDSRCYAEEEIEWERESVTLARISRQLERVWWFILNIYFYLFIY